MTARVLALCAGYGGLELGLELAGVDTTLVAYAEINKHAARVMAERWPDAPNLGDLTEISCPPAVDIVTAGFPCQPVSAAGLREGVNDARWIIRDVVKVWRDSGAPVLFLENVPGLLSANGGEAFGQVLEALAEVGATARWACVRASDVGAPHRRERWFCVATYSSHDGFDGAPPAWGRGAGSEDGDPSAAHAHGLAAGGHSGASSGPQAGREDEPGESYGDGPGLRGAAAADPDSGGLEVVRGEGVLDGVGPPHGDDVDGCSGERFGGYAPAVHRWERMTGRLAPEPTVPGKNRPVLSPRFVEWMMGLPEGHVTGTDVSRTQMLKILGNGVVPQQAAVAFRMLVLGDELAATGSEVLLPTPLARDGKGRTNTGRGPGPSLTDAVVPR